MYKVLYKGFNGGFSVSDEMDLDSAKAYKEKLINNHYPEVHIIKTVSNTQKEEMFNTDLERLYDAFVKLCDYIEQKTESSCADCPHNAVCFGLAGNEFAESLKRIRESIEF